jgi:hypothetical protein
VFIVGDIALGGGVLTVVTDVPFVVTVLLEVDSVTIGSAARAETLSKIAITNRILYIRFLKNIVDIIIFIWEHVKTVTHSDFKITVKILK